MTYKYYPCVLLENRNKIEEYLKFMVEHRGFSSATLGNHRLYLSRFFLWLQKKKVSIADLDPSVIQEYIRRSYHRKSRVVKKHIAHALRAFFRFLFLKGTIKRELDKTIPKLRFYKLSSVPSFLKPEEVERLLVAPDKRTESGRRDYAMLLLMARYGIRLKSVKTLKLSEINWDKREINFPALKDGKPVTVPLLPDVASALLSYIKHDRGKSTFEEVFLTVKNRGTGGRQHLRHPLSGFNHMSQFKNYYFKAKIDSAQKASHILRHSFATKLLADKIPILEIAKHLGQKHLDSAYIYAKVDIENLRSIAPTWPEVGSI